MNVDEATEPMLQYVLYIHVLYMYRLLKQSRTTNHIILYIAFCYIYFFLSNFFNYYFFTFQQAQEFGCLLVVYFAAQIYNQY